MTSTRNAPSSVGRPVNVPQVAATLATTRYGRTLSTTGSTYGGDGILVAVPEHTMITKGDRETVRAWVESVAPIVSARADLYFGSWRQGEELHLDVVQAFSAEDEDRAVAAGRARGQVAVWHNGRQEEIPTGGDGHRADLRSQLESVLTTLWARSDEAQDQYDWAVGDAYADAASMLAKILA